MSEKSERVARKIEKLLAERDLGIDGGTLRDILSEHLEQQPKPEGPPPAYCEICGDYHDLGACSHSFTCPKCNRVSYNPQDVLNNYCGCCHLFFPKEVESNPLAAWVLNEYKEWVLSAPCIMFEGQGGTGYYEIHLSPRPYYCDRGDWLIHVNGRNDIDWADGFPRYFFGTADEAKLQMLTWLNRRDAYKRTLQTLKP